MKHAELADITKRVSSRFESVEYFVGKLDLADTDIDKVQHEF